MLILINEEGSKNLAKTKKVLANYGFDIFSIRQLSDIESINIENTNIVLLSKHPKRRFNGNNSRRRFDFYFYNNIRAIGYCEGAPMDFFFWKSLHYRISKRLEEMPMDPTRFASVPLSKLEEKAEECLLLTKGL